MSTRYFRSYWGVPSSLSKPSVKGIPVAPPKSKIQKALRGFLVRKSLKKIISISNEVNQIEQGVLDHETIDLIRRDSRERLKISETLMNLLLRLDSVTSVDFGVRGCRKSVIKKAIALQEKLDLIASAPDSHVQGHSGVEVEADTNVSPEVNSDLHDEAGDNGSGRSEGISGFQSLVKQDNDVRAVDRASVLCKNVEAMPVSVPSEVVSVTEISQENSGHYASTVTVNPPLENETITEAKEDGLKGTPMDQFLHDDYVGISLAGEQSGACKTAGTASVEEEKDINSLPEIERDRFPRESKETVRDDVSKEEQNRDRELLQRMIEDNQRMLGLMTTV